MPQFRARRSERQPAGGPHVQPEVAGHSGAGKGVTCPPEEAVKLSGQAIKEAAFRRGLLDNRSQVEPPDMAPWFPNEPPVGA